ncbi:MAG: amino acid dehydrogenase [Deltaproteobacteria bacterium]|nr:amino acid dehydrogenase [Deltaproteobacteria bacterium]
MSLLEQMAALGAPRVLALAEPEVGLRALIVLDDVTLGPAAGGVRTRDYPDEVSALADAAALARAMTVKCALAGLAAGGGKAVLWPPPPALRSAAFERLGARIEELGGLFRTAGDLGTGPADLAALARGTRFVHTEERALAGAVARGLVGCVRACVRVRGAASDGDLSGLHVAVQGVGAIGAAVARALAAQGARLTLADIDTARVAALADELGARVVAPDALLGLDCDVLAPCAVGGVIGPAQAVALRAFALCGAANNLLAGADIAALLAERGVLVVPDQLASAGAVIEGIADTVMGLDAAQRLALIDRLGATAEEVLRAARASGRSSHQVALERAHAILRAAAQGKSQAARRA